MRGAFVDERAMRGSPGGRGCSGGACMAAGFPARHGVICPAGLRPALGRECAGLSWIGARCAVLPGGRAASGGACRAAGFTARGMGSFVRRASGLLLSGNARWARMGARFVRFAGLCADAAGGLLQRRLYGGGVCCAAWVYLSGGLAACFGAGVGGASGWERDARFCPAGGAVRGRCFGRRLYGGGVCCAAWGHLSGGLAEIGNLPGVYCKF